MELQPRIFHYPLPWLYKPKTNKFGCRIESQLWHGSLECLSTLWNIQEFMTFWIGGAPKCQGNSSFHQMMDDILPFYISPPSLSSTQQEWRQLIRDQLIDSVKQKGGRFLGWKDGKWLQLDDVEADEKISNAVNNFSKRANTKRSCQDHLARHSNFIMDVSKRRKLIKEGCTSLICWKY